MSKIYINNDWLFAKEFKEEYISGNDGERPRCSRGVPFNNKKRLSPCILCKMWQQATDSARTRFLTRL